MTHKWHKRQHLLLPLEKKLLLQNSKKQKLLHRQNGARTDRNKINKLNVEVTKM